jgi:nucleotide-binding universal stress UspA family protein
MGVIVVGVDHSDGAKAALRFALEEARLRQATLRVVHAWQFGYIVSGLEGAGAQRRWRSAPPAPGRFSLAHHGPETLSAPAKGIVALAIVVLAPVIALVTLTLGRGSPPGPEEPVTAAVPSATVPIAGSKERQWTSV